MMSTTAGTGSRPEITNGGGIGVEIDVVLLEQLSALADGELDAAESAATCACWRAEPAARIQWHAYHLIGDVLRSEDLAADPASDAAFMNALRVRMAREPVVLAADRPQLNGPFDRRFASVAAVRRSALSSWRWKASSAVAAGFVAVAGVFMFMRTVDPAANAGSSLARAEPPGVTTLAANAPVVRDPRLDTYLMAHKQFAGSSALGVPSAFVRAAMWEGPGR